MPSLCKTTLFVLLAASTVLVYDSTLAADSKKPRANHFEGGFLNPSTGRHRDPPMSVAVPFFIRRIVSSLSGGAVPAPHRVANDGSFLRTNAKQSVPTVTWVGHSTLSFKWAMSRS